MTAKRRCAVYTRTSTEEGLGQDFNSLHAQAEACAAYTKSQVGEGWSLVPKAYEDGGYSGGSLDRPALQRLLADIEARKIDVVVVYKVDRLTRSLADFAKIVEILDKAGASFVSVTQSFNTTTSMGRLTLNVLLSFAQFEREVTGERIRDKFAASKAKGMWMGGIPSLGYDIKQRHLVINPDEADRVGLIFRRFLELGSVPDLAADLKARGIFSKQWVSAKGIAHGGVPFTRGALYALLSNPIYRGVVRHKGKLHPGQHQAILDQDLWDEVQSLKGAPQRRKSPRRQNALLAGKLFDDRNNPMAPSTAYKRSVRYRYYVSTALTREREKSPGTLGRVAMTVLDDAVVGETALLLAEHWRPMLSIPERVQAALHRVCVSAATLTFDLSSDAVDLLRLDALAPGRRVTATEERISLVCPIALARPRNATALIRPGASPAAPRPDRALIRAIAMAHAWMRRLDAGAPRSITALAKAEKLCFIHTSKLLPLAYLAPDLVEMVLEGRQPPRLTLSALIDARLPMSWDEQRAKVAALNQS